MEEEWNWKVSSMAGLRESVDDKMEEQIGVEELKNEKVRSKEEKIDWRIQEEIEIKRGWYCPKRDTGRFGFWRWPSSFCDLMNSIMPCESYQILFPLHAAKKQGLGQPHFTCFVAWGERPTCGVWAIHTNHLKPKPPHPIPSWTSPPSELHWGNFFCSEERGKQRKHISDLNKGTS